MINKAPESPNIEQEKLGIPGAEPEYIPQIPKTPEEQKDTTSDIEATKAELDAAYDTTQSTATKKKDEITSETQQNKLPTISTAVKQLDRPEAEEGLIQSYQTGEKAFNDMVGWIKGIFGGSSKKE